MATSTESHTPGPAAPGHHADEHTARHWTEFAAIMIGLGGILNVIWGIAALSDAKLFQTGTGYSLSELHTVGWISLLVGILMLGAAYSIWNGGDFGKYFGILVAGLNAISALLSIKAEPFWAICVFAIDVLIIYALVHYGGRGLPIGSRGSPTR
jgi:uncharacterized RDD family membrane protein YckC